MATTPKRFITTGSKAIAEAVKRNQNQRNALAQATTLLRPEEVGGAYDTKRVLFTTLGGSLRPITHADLKQFAHAVRQLGKKFTGGITAQQVLDLSLPIDRTRANREIRAAVPMASKAGVIHFVTNAGPESTVTRHHVHVEFLNYAASLASPAAPVMVASELTKGRLRFRCDCGRHLYWYSYLCTVGKFIYGDPQMNYPKIRNPKLVGVGCKHVLRVMQNLQTPAIKGRVAQMIEAGRKGQAYKPSVLTKKQAQDIANEQAAQAHWKRSKVESSAEKRKRLVQQRAIQSTVKRSSADLTKMTPAKIRAAKAAFEAQARKLASVGAFTAKQLQTMLAKLKG